MRVFADARTSPTGDPGGDVTTALPARTAAPSPRRPQLRALPPPPRVELEDIAPAWQLALDAADRASGAAAASLPAAEATARRRGVEDEREVTQALLTRVGRLSGLDHPLWLAPLPVTAPLLGLPAGVRACLFDLDGVLTDSTVVHRLAWAQVFDDLLLRVSEKTGWHFVPFKAVSDYRDYVDGRPRLEAIHAFLDSRGVRVPEGRPDDDPSADTAYGLAKRKGEAVARGLRGRGVAALPGARRYLEAAGRAGIARAVISASASTLPMLRLAGLADVVEERVDADVMSAQHLRARPAPDLLLVACRRLGVDPCDAVSITNSPAGVAAAHAAGVAVIGVGEGAQGELLHGYGAERVAPSLRALLDRRIADVRPRR